MSGPQYASAATLGAPQAIQCADRFHICKNLTEALQPLLSRCQAEMLAPSVPQDSQTPPPHTPTLSLAEWRPKIPAHVERVQQARRAERSARYEQAVELNRQGKPPKEIAKVLGVTGRTIQRWVLGHIDTGGEVKDVISGRLLHEAFEWRGARLFWRFSSQKARELKDIDGSRQSYMAQMGFAQPDIT